MKDYAKLSPATLQAIVMGACEDPTWLQKDIDPNGDFILCLMVPAHNNTLEQANDNHTTVYDASLENKRYTYRFRVSSKHLRRASTVFDEAFTHWQQMLEEEAGEEPLELPLRGHNQHAFSIVLQLLHDPKSVELVEPGLPLLVDIARVVLEFQCADAIKDVSSKWLSKRHFSRDWEVEDCQGANIQYELDETMQPVDHQFESGPYWLFVSWALRDAESFNAITREMIKSPLSIMAMELPLMESLIGDIDGRRLQVLSFLGSRIKKWRQKARGFKLCQAECDELHLHAIEFTLAMYRITDDELSSPTQDCSVQNFLSVLESLLASCENAKEMPGRFCGTGCRLASAMEPFLDRLSEMKEGFRLNNDGTWSKTIQYSMDNYDEESDEMC